MALSVVFIIKGAQEHVHIIELQEEYLICKSVNVRLFLWVIVTQRLNFICLDCMSPVISICILQLKLGIVTENSVYVNLFLM